MAEAVENEFKFTTDKNLDDDSVTEELISFLKSKGIPFAVRKKHSVDRYYDSVDLALYRSDCIMRMKTTSKGKIKLTAKKPISGDGALFSRREVERSSDGSFGDVLAFAGEEFPWIELEEEPALVLECFRTSIDYTDGSGINLSYDHCTFIHGNDRKDFREIELECMSDSACSDFDETGILDIIEESLGFHPASESKYRRGIDWIKGKN